MVIVTKDFIQNTVGSRDSGNPLTETSEIVTANAENRPAASVKKPGEVQLSQLIGLEADNPLWDTLISQMTANELFDLVKDCAFRSPADEFIGKPQTIEVDGPSGYTKSTVRKGNDIYDTCFYCSESLVGSAWSRELAYAMGVSIGNEGLVGDERDTHNTYNGLYAPGMNLHRTPFGGRNPEYYSEDPVLSGGLAVSMIEGASSKGVYCFMKHFAVNDQETHRNGVCTWLTEQALRELYLKPFELAVKNGGATALMTSFNRVGSTWAGGSYALLTEVLRGEWGFRGAVVTDFASGQSQMDIRQMVYAGGDMWFDTITPSKWYDKASDLDTYLLQESGKHILYMVANSNAMNGLGDSESESVVTETRTAPWRTVLYGADAVVAVALIAWTAAVFIRRKRRVDG